MILKMKSCLKRFKVVSSDSVVGVQCRRGIRDREFISLRMIGQGWLAELTKHTANVVSKVVYGSIYLVYPFLLCTLHCVGIKEM